MKFKFVPTTSGIVIREDRTYDMDEYGVVRNEGGSRVGDIVWEEEDPREDFVRAKT